MSLEKVFSPAFFLSLKTVLEQAQDVPFFFMLLTKIWLFTVQMGSFFLITAVLQNVFVCICIYTMRMHCTVTAK